MPKTEINEAVRELRLALGDTQQQFAQRLGLAISSVVRYELTSEPGPHVLVKLADLALENQQMGVSEVLNRALRDQLGAVALRLVNPIWMCLMRARRELSDLHNENLTDHGRQQLQKGFLKIDEASAMLAALDPDNQPKGEQ